MRHIGVMVTIALLLLGSLVVTRAQAAADEGQSETRADTLLPQAAPDGVWGSFTPLGIGMSDDVYALALHDDTLFAGGAFFYGSGFMGASGVVGTNRIAAWSLIDDTWSALGAGVNGNDVYALAAEDDTLYAGGVFTDASGVANTANIATWSAVDDTWTPLANGTSNTVAAIHTPARSAGDDTVFIGGAFTGTLTAPGAVRIATWSDDTWGAMGLGASSTVTSLVSTDDTVYAGGNFSFGAPPFTGMSGIPNTNRVAAWSLADDTWSALGSGANSWVYALAPRGGDLFVGGAFTSASAVASTSRIAMWSNTSGVWSAVGGGLDGDVRSLVLDASRDLLYVGGSFSSSSNANLARVAVWDIAIAEWIPLQFAVGSGGANGAVRSMTLDDSILYVGGAFTDAGGDTDADYIAQWNWNPPRGANAVNASADDTITVTGQGFVGVPASGAVRIGSTSATYTRDDSVTLSVRVPGLSNGTYAIHVDAVGGEGNVGTVTVSGSIPPAPPPVFPPSEPLNVIGVAGDASAEISWDRPASSGSFAVTDYQVEVSPGGHSCVVKVPDLSCTIAGLTNGTVYTARVRALNGAGWGPWSHPSGAFTPADPVTKTIVITGTRADLDGRRGVQAFGETTGLVGATVQARVHLSGEINYYSGSRRQVGDDGTFTWQRKTNKKVYVYFRVVDDPAIRSNRLIIPLG